MQKSSHLNDSVSREIRAEMARQSMTQDQLAKRAQLGAQSQLSKRLRGVTHFSTDEIERIARALDIPVHQLTSPRALAG